MYCPRCGQQASEEVSFCSRCGLPLDDAAGLPHARTRPASDFAGRSADTADMAAPPSVADATTKLLEEDA